MEIDEKIVGLLNRVNFAQRYLSLCEKYPYFNDNLLVANNIEDIHKILISYNSQIKYIKSENFFKLKEKISSLNFQFNIIIKYEVVQLVLDLKLNNERLRLGWGTWESIASELLNKSFEIKPRPCFHNYEELRDIIKIAFSIYEDFKREVVPMFGESLVGRSV